MKFFKEKEPIVNERKDQDSTRIGKLEDIITNLGFAFSSMQNTPTPPTKISKLMYLPKNKGDSSSKEKEDSKMISVHPNFIEMIKEPMTKQIPQFCS